MHLSFRAKIILYNIAALIICLVSVSFFITGAMQNYAVNNALEYLGAFSEEIQLIAAQEISVARERNIDLANIDSLTELASQLAVRFQTITASRVHIYGYSDAGVTIIADSASEADIEVETVEMESSYPAMEVNASFQSGQKAYVYTVLSGRSYLMYAVPILDGEDILGVVRIAYSIGMMDNLVTYTSGLFVVATIIAVVIIFIVLFWLNQRIMEPITEVTQMSRNMAKGDLDKRFVVFKTRDEVDLLRENFNQMADEIQKRIQDFEEKQAELTLMLSSVDSGVIALDQDGKIVMLNTKVKEFFGYEEMSDEGIQLAMLPELKELVAQLNEESELVRSVDLDEKSFSINVRRIDNEGIGIDVLIIINDITRDKMLMKEQNKFLSSISHELRTPLTTIIGYADMLKRRGTDNAEVTSKAMDVIYSEGGRLSRLVDDVLSMRNYEKMDFSMTFEDMDVSEALSEVIEQMRMRSMRYGIDIEYVSSPLPRIYGDYDRLKQVFINIIDNAIKYSYEGGRIKITALEDGKGYIHIDFRDHGIGVPRTMEEDVFKAFYRVDEERSRERGGVGLGLSIVRQIITKHGGDVMLTSKEGEGTLVSVILPSKKIKSTDAQGEDK